MTKQDFFGQLLPMMAGLPQQEQQRVIDYYEELILDGVESGRDEEALIASFGKVEDVARKIWEDYAAPPPKKRNAGIWILIGCAWFFGVIIGLPLAIAAAVLYLCGWIVLLCLAICAVALGLSGVYACVSMAFFLVSSPLNAVFQFGSGVLVLGLGVLLAVGTWKLFVLYGRFTGWLTDRIKRVTSRKEVRYAS